jgi:parallel beta-helix repeat protein
MSLTKVSYSMITGAPVNVLDYGAVGNGVADDTSAIQAAIATGNSIFYPAGTYNVNASLLPQSNTTWTADNNATLKWTSVNCLIDAQAITNWTMEGITVDGNYTAYAPVSLAQYPWGIRLESSTNITIRNNVFKQIWRIGICVGHLSATECKDIVIDNNVIYDIGKATDPKVGFGNGVAILSASNVKVTNNWIYNITGNTSGTGGINCEPGNATYVCSDIEIAFNKVTDCNDCAGVILYQPIDFTSDRSNINIHNNTIKVTGTAPGIRCEQFGYTYIRDNYLEQTQGILVKRYKANKAFIEGNEILQVTTGGYGIRIQDGIAGVVIDRNRIRNVAGVAISADMYDLVALLSTKDCLIQNNVITSVTGAGIEFNAGNFVVSGNTLVSCSNASDYYIKAITGGASQSLNGYIGENTLVSASGSILAFINIEGTLMNNVQIGTNSYVGPILPTMKTQTFLIGGRNPGVFMDVLPAAGTWQVGDIIWKATPAASGFIGWVCTTAGTPGTFKTFGTIQA